MDIRYAKILVPVDGSQNSFAALTHAVQLAKLFQAEIGILHVAIIMQQLPIATQFNDVYLPESVLTHVQDFSETVLKEARKQIPTDIPVQTFCEIGSPAIIIPEFAEQNGYDLIVIGSRGLGVIKGLFMGSVSNYVVNHAKCPVLVIK
ncbi:MAG: universal stress protein [Sporomusaceae bacterium]|nr:universal stress protein [Sporomusaceae bacterium]